MTDYNLDDLDFSHINFEQEKKNKRVPLELFLKTVVEAVKIGGNSVSVAHQLGISPQGVRQRCHKLRAKGIPVPEW